MIPLTAKIIVKNKNKTVFWLWLPFFLIWIIILPLLAVIAPIIFITALLLLKSGRGKMIASAYFTVFALIGSLSGLKLDIESKENIIYINLI